MGRLKAILDSVIKRASVYGHDILSNGAQLIGKIPHVAPEARLHVLFQSLNEKEISQLEANLNKSIPIDFKEFLLESNGLTLFSGALSLYGLRKNFNRTGDDAWQPFSIIIPNTGERPQNLADFCVVIGGYNYDGSKLYIDSHNGKVYRCERKAAQNRLNEWESFWKMLESEVERLSQLFDERGRKKDLQKPTIP